MARNVDCKYHEPIDYDKLALCRIGRFGGLVSDSMCVKCPLNSNNTLSIKRHRKIDETIKPYSWFKPVLGKRANLMATKISKRDKDCINK